MTMGTSTRSEARSRTPFRTPLNLFKGLYYLVSAANPVRTWNAWRRRQRNIRDLDVAAS